MRVHGWVADRQGCGWYRVALPLHGLRQWGGHQVSASERLPPNMSTVDVLIGQRVCLPGPSETWQRLCRERRLVTVYEVDDDLLEVDPSSELAYQYYADRGRRDAIAANAAAADVVTVSTEYLADVMRRYNPRVVVLPNVIDGGLLEVARPRRERLTVGWAGSATHCMDMVEAASSLRQFLRRHGDVGMHLIGEDYRRLVAGTDQALAGRIRHTGWQSEIAAYYMAIDFDIGLAPLRPHVFNRSKSPIKALEYAALGIPTVAADAGPYPEFVVHGETGYLVRRPHEWAWYLHRLADNPDLRDRMGQAARELASQWTIAARWRAWEDTYMRLISERAA